MSSVNFTAGKGVFLYVTVSKGVLLATKDVCFPALYNVVCDLRRRRSIRKKTLPGQGFNDPPSFTRKMEDIPSLFCSFIVLYCF